MENRIEAGMREWTEKANRLKQLFGEGITQRPDFQKTRLDHYRGIASIPLAKLNDDERMMRRILKSEINVLERVLYPNPLVRAVRSMQRAFARSETVKPVAPAAQPLEIQPAKKDLVQMRREIKPIVKHKQHNGKRVKINH